MAQEWAPSTWGQLFTGSKPWRLRLVDENVELSVDGKVHRATIDGSSPLRVQSGTFWADLTLHTGSSHTVKVDGLSNDRAKGLENALHAILTAQLRRQRQGTLTKALGQIGLWLEAVARQLRLAQDERRWTAHEQQQALVRARPKLSTSDDKLLEMSRDAEVQAGLTQSAAHIEKTLQIWQADWPAFWAKVNEEHVCRELNACKDLFDRVESKPLTQEQARAVICFDNRVQVVASAGSGKTSTMVAKAAYAIHRGFAKPERILLLAFNKKAAEELQERAARAFGRLGMGGVAVEACTFHALGRRIIGKATGRMPDVPEWAVETGEGLRRLSEIVDQLKDGSDAFRTRWDLFRLVFGRDLPQFGQDTPAEEWDKDGVGYVRTLRGERVRSQEECVIANWLFYNGVNYLYEPRYEFDTATDEYRQYRPDFYYPDIKLYHEHLALNAKGEAPPHFTRYLEDLAWKRQEHRRRGTALVETTSHQLRTDQLFSHLDKALADRGVVLDPNPDRPIPEDGQIPMENSDLLSLVRTFISHAKSNCLSIEMLTNRLRAMPEDSFKHRHRMFLELVAPVLQAWDAALTEEHGIDFEDMLNQAAEHLEQRRYESPYELVMADEFQDASRARARLCRALVQQPGRHLFAVGDDWQSINRFAGADVSVMAGFREWFGHGQVLRLEQTFRCPQKLCDVSSRFVSKNPAQIKKEVRSNTSAHGPVLQAFRVTHRHQLQGAIDDYIAKLYQGIQNGTVLPGSRGKVSVFILGRYNADRAYVPSKWKALYGDHIEVAFLTVHRSKGAEADYVILPGMVHRGFPNLRADDPVLALAMPSGDTFPLSEERRLFYVGLTRARRSVAMFTVLGQSSSFLDELVKDQAVAVTNIQGEPVQELRCPVCKKGVIVTRDGRYGPFQACSNYPKCEHKPKIQRPARSGSQVSTTGNRMVRNGVRQSEPRRESERVASRASTGRGQGLTDISPAAMTVFEALHAWRDKTARDHGVPGYVIFHDFTLREIAMRRPVSSDELSLVPGVGAVKRERYGEGILQCVRDTLR